MILGACEAEGVGGGGWRGGERGRGEGGGSSIHMIQNDDVKEMRFQV